MFFSIATVLDEADWQRILNINPSVRDMILHYHSPQDYFHFSWMVCEGMNQEEIFTSLKYIAGQKSSFTIQSGGIGIFPGNIPAITYVLSRSPEMTEMHSMLWNNCVKHVDRINTKYAPDCWIPHITLLHQGLESRKYCEFLEKSVDSEISFEIKVNNLSVIYKDEMSDGMLFSCTLK